MKTTTVLVFIFVSFQALAQDKPQPPAQPAKLVYRTLDKMLKQYSRAAEAQVQLVAKR